MDTVKVSGASGDSEDIGEFSGNDEVTFDDGAASKVDASCSCKNDSPSLGRAVFGERKQGLRLLPLILVNPGERDLDVERE